MNSIVFIELTLFLLIQGSFGTTRYPPGKPSRLIKPLERIGLLGMIEGDNAPGIKTFFKAKGNTNIDFPLITFKSTDTANHGDEIHGFTPLSAAIFHCKIEVIDVLYPIQYATKWTTFAPPGYSHAELAAKHCPELITKRRTAGLYADMFADLNANQLFKMFVVAKEMEKSSVARNEIIVFITNHFKSEDKTKSTTLLLEFVDVWIETGKELGALSIEEIWKDYIDNLEGEGDELNNETNEKTLTDELLTELAVKLAQAGHAEEFKKICTYFKDDKADALLVMGARHLSPDNFETSQKLKFPIDFQKLSQATTSFTNNLYDIISESIEFISSEIKIIQSFINAGTVQRITRRYFPSFYSFIIKQFPRVDVAVMFTGDSYKIIHTGDDGLVIEWDDAIRDAYILDDPAILELLLKGDYKSLDLRFQFAPYKLTLLKAAVALGKPKIMAELIKNHSESLNSSTRLELTALEMAACYWPDFLVEHIVPFIGADCSERLKAANNLIAMFTEVKVQKCRTGATNGAVVLKALLTSADPKEVSCINLGLKDYIHESIKLRHPIEMTKALYETGYYKDIEAYIDLAIARGDYPLFEYFVGKLNGAESESLKFGLVKWIHMTSGLPTTANIKFLEFFLAHPKTDINVRDTGSGSTALSMAVKGGHLWIVKRLLLCKDLNVNLSDSKSKRTPLHHAISQFSNMNDDLLSEVVTLGTMGLNERIQVVMKNVLEDLALPRLPPMPRSVSEAYNKLVARIEVLINSTPPSTTFISWFNSIFDLFMRTRYQYEPLEVRRMFKDWMFTFVNDQILSQIELRERFKVSPNHGFLHNVLLAHPDIDASIQDSNSINAVHLTKNRALYFGGNEGPVKEMARTHFRIINIDSVRGDKQSAMNIALVAISSIIIGSASIGIVRWML